MNLSGFCRNCLAKWYLAGAKDNQVEMTYDDARKKIYGMPYVDWKEKHQKPASNEQMAKYKETAPDHSEISRIIKG